MVSPLIQSIPALSAGPPVLGVSSNMIMLVLPVLGSMLLFYGLFQIFVESKTSRRKKMQDRLRGRRTKPEKEAPSIMRRGGLQQSRSLADLAIGKFKFVPRVQTLLDQADLNWSAAQFLVNLLGAGILTAVGLAVIQGNIVVAIGCGAGVITLPMMWLNMRRNKRIRKIGMQLPDVFDMMGQALRAGQSLPGAVQLIYEQMPPPIATEFAQVYHEQNLGIRIEDALKSMAARVDSLDVKFFVTAVMIQRQTGGDLAEVLDKISGVIRERIELAGMVRGLTAEGRLSGWVLFALPIGVFLAVSQLNPGYANVLIETTTGKILLLIAGGMQLMGLALIRWIVNIKV